MLEGKALADLASIAAPLPPVSDDEIFTPQQWTTMLSICDVFFPSISITRGSLVTPESGGPQQAIQKLLPDTVPPEVVHAYFQESASTKPEFKEGVRRRFIEFVPVSQRKGLALIMSTLDTRLGCLLLTGSTTSIHLQPLEVRTQIVCAWQQSYLPALRAIFGSMEAMTRSTWPPLSRNLRQIIDFPDVPKHIERNPSFEYEFLDFSSYDSEKTVEITADIVIVGSGCGAGVMASHLAAATKSMHPRPRILVIEKGYHFPASHFPMEQPAAGTHLFEAGGGLVSDEVNIALLAGSTWGGGGTVNWSASLQPQHFVREEWASQGLPYFTSAEFQSCLDTICEKMGVCKITDDEAKSRIPHSYANRTLIEGARRLGMTAEVVPQNTKGKAHFCGSCGLGCASATKQGPANCWLPDAASNGAKFIQGCFVQEILFDETRPSSQPRKAIGVKTLWKSADHLTTRKLTIRCPRVVVSAGTLHSPLLLMRSDIKNHHLGNHLHLHPTTCVVSVWDDKVNPWEGPILTSAVTSLENLDGQHHGPKVEVMLGTPDSMMSWLPFRPHLSLDAIKHNRTNALSSALDYRLRLAKYAHSFGLIVIQRDVPATSRVYFDPDDPLRSQVRLSYKVSQGDKRGLLAGAAAAARMAYVMGALEIEVCIAAVDRFVRPANRALADELFELWVGQLTAPDALRLLDMPNLGSAHQMGTCRMSASADRGVVDQLGRVWGTEGVYVADASVFPSASGVNPMVTTMGVALGIAKGIEREMNRELSGGQN